ncbi:Ig-like domain-containing protein [Deinococcus sp. A31D244]|uniref:Ig-like domain-containing protein n=1 Tax=Deinococcus sp. A31D244 TaxID=3397675 RepID=UPI0039E0030C
MKRFGSLSLLALTGALMSCGIGPIDTTAPTATLTITPKALVAAGTVNMTATATDAEGISKVEFYDNGTLIATDTTSPYSASKAYAFADNGTHTLSVKAYDYSANMGQASDTLTVAIADVNEPNDSVAAATALSVGTPVKGVIAGQDRDKDYYKFTAAAGEALKLTVQSVSVDAKSTLDPYVMILMPDGRTVLEKDDDSGAGLESEIRFNAPAAGTYTAVVTSFDIHDDATAKNDRVTNTYQIALTRR